MLQGCVRLSVVCDVWTDFNSLAYHIPASSVDYQKNSFFYCTVTDWNCLPCDTVRIPWTIQGLCICINCIWGTPPVVVKGSREPSVRSQKHSTLFYLISTTPILQSFVMHSDAGTSAASGHSGIFNVLKFDHISKKERKDMFVAKRCVLEQMLYWQPIGRRMRGIHCYQNKWNKMTVTFV